MTEGTVPDPPRQPFTKHDNDVVPVQELSRLGGAIAAGVKPP